jgi:molybdenum cofactor cytidylyltransferase
MGVGGLLKEIPTRPQPRDVVPAQAPRAPKVAAIVLAAGKSSRMGANKLLMPLKGQTMIARTVDAVLASPARPVIVVVGNEAGEIEAALQGRKVTFVGNPHFADGLSTSLHAGIAALPGDVDGALVCLGDMPAVPAAAMAKLVAALNPGEGRAIVVPTYQGKRGNPVLFARALLPEAAAVHGDSGAKHIIAEHEDVVCEVEMDDASVLADADTPAAFAALEAQIRS